MSSETLAELRETLAVIATERAYLARALEQRGHAVQALAEAAPTEYEALYDIDAAIAAHREQIKEFEEQARQIAAVIDKAVLPKGLGHRVTKKAEFDNAEAVAWCVRHDELGLLLVDQRAYGEIVKTGVTSAPGRVTEHITVTIATDLSSYLEARADDADDADDADEGNGHG